MAQYRVYDLQAAEYHYTTAGDALIDTIDSVNLTWISTKPRGNKFNLLQNFRRNQFLEGGLFLDIETSSTTLI